MGTYDSLYSALSGMNANGLAISVVGDNLANLNTIGYKASRATFQDVLGQTLIGSTGARRLGQGVSLKSIDQIHSQGGFQTTGRETDLAIAGNGFFVVRDPEGGPEAQYFTRAGQFTYDDGLLLSPSGYRLQGYMADPTGSMGTTVGDLDVGGATSAPNATTGATLGVNLYLQDGQTSLAPGATVDATNAHYSTEMTVYDSLGEAHQVTYYFAQADDPATAGTTEWAVNAVSDGASVGSGTLTFDGTSALTGGSPLTLNLALTNGATTPQAVTVDLAGSTWRAGKSGVTGMSQDGYAAGSLENLAIGDDGTITGTFSNGKTRTLARLALATFASTDGLERQGGNVWSRTPSSGEPLIGAAGTDGRGAVMASTLEASNVDLTQEFIQLITAQRGFQASSRTVSTVDQILQEAVSLKR